MTNKLAQAISIAALAFEGKTDKGGKPYILHCLWVMGQVDQEDEDLMICAVLHDLVEDTEWTFKILIELGFSERVIWVLKLLTRDKGQPYNDYITAIYENSDAKAIKKKDLTHNMDITRLNGYLTKNDIERLEKYHRSYVYLCS